jgi:hypothetical protein
LGELPRVDTFENKHRNMNNNGIKIRKKLKTNIKTQNSTKKIKNTHNETRKRNTNTIRTTKHLKHTLHTQTVYLNGYALCRQPPLYFVFLESKSEPKATKILGYKVGVATLKLHLPFLLASSQTKNPQIHLSLKTGQFSN